MIQRESLTNQTKCIEKYCSLFLFFWQHTWKSKIVMLLPTVIIQNSDTFSICSVDSSFYFSCYMFCLCFLMMCFFSSTNRILMSPVDLIHTSNNMLFPLFLICGVPKYRNHINNCH